MYADMYTNRAAIEALKRQIVIAFADAQYPGDQNIGDSPPGYVLESDQVVDFFRGKSWQQISYQDLVRNYKGDHRAVLHFMSPDAFRYYLPALLTTTFDYLLESGVKDVENAAQEVYSEHSSLVFALTRPESAEAQVRFDQRVATFTSTQKKAIVSFLEFVVQEHSRLDWSLLAEEASEALNSYWSPPMAAW